MNVTRDFVHFLYGLEPRHLSGEVVDRAKYLLLDYLGVAIRGSIEESSRSVQRMVERTGAGGPCGILGTPLRSSPGYAALANGAAAHAIELDDTHQAGSIHLGVVMFPVAIALGQSLPGVDADRFFTSVVAGYETAARLGMAVQPKIHYEMGFHPTSTCGVFGAAVTAAKLLRLTEGQMLSAVGIAGSMAAGSLEFLADGSWTKRLHPGLAAQNGMQAAMLAAEGFRGPSTILEGRDGFLSSYSRDADPEAVTRGLGQTFEILRTSVKPHACCRYMQTPIDALCALSRQHDIRPEDVARIEVAVLEAGWPLVCEPGARKYRPESIVDAQFSMPFGAAIAILYRDASLERFTVENIQTPEIRSLMEKVVLTKDPRIEAGFPSEWAARVSVQLTNGRQYEGCVRNPKGDPENPLSWDELVGKFRGLARAVLPADRCDRIAAEVRGEGFSLSSMLKRRTGFSAGTTRHSPPTGSRPRRSPRT
jgi:2-methylcitrate dehydratase PrpD